MNKITIEIPEDVGVNGISEFITVEGRYTGYILNSDPEVIVQQAKDLLAVAEFIRNKSEEGKEQKIRNKMVELAIIFYHYTDSPDDQHALRRFKHQIESDPAMVQNWRRLAEALIAAGEDDAVQEQA